MADESKLSPYVLKDLKGLDPTTSQAKGTGSYGSVYHVTVDGFPCVAKRLHDILTTGYRLYGSVSTEDVDAIRRRFREECVLLCKLRHPNIVQFIGVHYGSSQRDLILVMEALYMDLSTCLSKHPIIPIYMKRSILLDASYGLLYLHSQNPPIIHRDLTATNVLVTRDMKAKLADLGVSKILNLHPLHQLTHTACPGTLGVMPPEALVEEPDYDTKLDVFSFGCLILHTVNHEFPLPFGVKPRKFKKGEEHIAKRKCFIDRMGKDHCLHPLVLRCLQDDPERRPNMAEVSRELSVMVVKQPSTQYDDVLHMFEEMERINKENVHLKKEQQVAMESKCAHQEAVRLHVTAAESLKKALKQKEDENKQLQAKLKLVREKNSVLTAEVQQLIVQIEKIGRELFTREDLESLQKLFQENEQLRKELTEDLAQEEEKETREELRVKIQELEDNNTELKKRKESALRAKQYLEENLRSLKQKLEAQMESTSFREQSVECETTTQENGPVENEQLTVPQLKQDVASLRSLTEKLREKITELTRKNEKLQAELQAELQTKPITILKSNESTDSTDA